MEAVTHLYAPAGAKDLAALSRVAYELTELRKNYPNLIINGTRLADATFGAATMLGDVHLEWNAREKAFTVAVACSTVKR